MLEHDVAQVQFDKVEAINFDDRFGRLLTFRIIREFGKNPSAPTLADAKLLLEACRGGRVLEYHTFTGVHDALGRLGHQGRFVETGEDQLQLARIPVDIADGEDARFRGFERLDVNRNEILVEVKSPIGNRARASWSGRRMAAGA